MDWRHSDVLKLIDSYREYECLWNSLSPDYKQQEMKKSSWIALSKEFGKTVEEIKKKIKHLRTNYMAEKKKVDTIRDTNGEQIYDTQLYYYNQISFLDSIIVRRPTYQVSDPLSEKKLILLKMNRQKKRSLSTDSEKEESQLDTRSSIGRLDSTNSSKASLPFNLKPTVRLKRISLPQRKRLLSTDSEKDEQQLELKRSNSRLDSANSSPKAYPRFTPKPTVRRKIANYVPKTKPPKKDSKTFNAK